MKPVKTSWDQFNSVETRWNQLKPVETSSNQLKPVEKLVCYNGDEIKLVHTESFIEFPVNWVFGSNNAE